MDELGRWVVCPISSHKLNILYFEKFLFSPEKHVRALIELSILEVTGKVESILLYGCESWSMTESMVKSLSGAYTRMLRKALNVHWSSRTTNDEVYGELPRLDVKIAERRLRLAGHCYRHPELSTQKLILWEPTHGTRSRGRPQSNYVDTLKRDTGAISSLTN
ncbi:hypothetical protein AC249_AIPGENE10771 [Exaiptasia diaphana]|nr:hypothetical protein AC249_AIPGENE10771 [Exaiptasia diaphana]